MLKVRYSAQFKKDFKLAKKRGLPLQKLKDVLEMLALEKPLGEKYYDHPLKGKYVSFREWSYSHGLAPALSNRS